MNKISIGSENLEIAPAEVVYVDYKGTNKEKLYTVRCKLLHAFGSLSSTDTITARPIDSSIKKIPIVGEIIGVTRAPTSYGAAVKQTSEYYYMPYVYNIQGSVHHNGIPGKHTIDTADTNNTYKASSSGHTKTNTSNVVQLDKLFPERKHLAPLQPYTGDVLIEGRFGQSIRFGSTLQDNNEEWSVNTPWRRGASSPGDPILIIRNGQAKPSTSPYEFIVENLDKDASSIWMASGQELPYTIASTTLDALKRLGNDSYETDNKKRSGNQLVVNSGRVLVQAQDREVLIIAKQGVSIATDGNTTIDAQQTIEMEGNRINLGLDAVHPALLGDDTTDWLNRLLNQLQELCTQLSKEIHLTGFGPSSPPTNAPNYINIKLQLKGLQQQLPTLLSNQTFLNKNPGGPDA